MNIRMSRISETEYTATLPTLFFSHILKVNLSGYATVGFSKEIACITPHSRIVRLDNDMIEKIELQNAEVISQKILYLKTNEPILFSRHWFEIEAYELVRNNGEFI